MPLTYDSDGAIPNVYRFFGEREGSGIIHAGDVKFEHSKVIVESVIGLHVTRMNMDAFDGKISMLQLHYGLKVVFSDPNHEGTRTFFHPVERRSVPVAFGTRIRIEWWEATHQTTTQWAAVRTWTGEIIDPPQKSLSLKYLKKRATIRGNAVRLEDEKLFLVGQLAASLIRTKGRKQT